MTKLLKRLFTFMLLGVVAPPLSANAQSPSLVSLNVIPPNPTAAVDVQAQVGGVVNISGSPIIRTESRRVNNDVRVDVLIDELPVLAPAVINPWSQIEELGLLPPGAYTLTARLFWDHRQGPNSSFPDPWTFPDSYGQPLTPGSNGLLVTTFNVVPEPSTALMALAGMMGVGAVHRTFANRGKR